MKQDYLLSSLLKAENPICTLAQVVNSVKIPQFDKALDYDLADVLDRILGEDYLE